MLKLETEAPILTELEKLEKQEIDLRKAEKELKQQLGEKADEDQVQNSKSLNRRRKTTILMGNFYFASDCFPDTIFMKDRYLLKDQDQESNYKYIKVDGLDTRVVAMIQIET